MRSLFFRIYLGLLIAALLLLGGTGIMYQYWQKDRVLDYLSTTLEASLALVVEGLSRHQGSQQEAWLGISRRITSLPIELVDAQDVPQHIREHTPAKTLTLVASEHSQTLDVQAYAYQKLNTDDTLWIQVAVEESSINEQLVRGSILLLLNEIGRYPKEKRQEVFANWQNIFNFPVHWLRAEQIKVNYLQERALKRKETVVEFFTNAQNERGIRALAPIGNSGDFLQLGPILLLDPFPRVWVISAGIINIVLLIIIGFLLVHPLERRLERMAKEVDALRLSGQAELLTIEGQDALTALAKKINTMSSWIYQLLQSQRELNRAVSHELKTPLARLRFRRELALTKLEQLEIAGVNTEAVKQHLLGMATSIDELNHLVEESLLYARLEALAPDLKLEVLDLFDWAQEIVQPFTSQYPDLEFTQDIYQSRPVHADAHQLRRALQNLLTNAQRYANQRVHLYIHQSAHFTFIQVEDDGVGIPETQWESVLEPFKRVESSRSRQTGGSGLGLAIVSQIMKWHQGEIILGYSSLGGLKVILKLPNQKMQTLG
ncbi:two-component system, OmpR family, sensor histidine kinase RstB [Allopseudospirillum japonicum]|uniref:histidine kinase n=1 Tax=Allopseudospirillum japonicum TaxID=64971 RepID=A0A1H6S8V4_9GAMM|nr:ATP-binding protein [Allopseudospirillum japonicum]SEI64463.1 two-component system, OmpR family, sensor histidine kinase RstB [Allopseudospirillum japonicum]